MVTVLLEPVTVRVKEKWLSRFFHTPSSNSSLAGNIRNTRDTGDLETLALAPIQEMATRCWNYYSPTYCHHLRCRRNAPSSTRQ